MMTKLTRTVRLSVVAGAAFAVAATGAATTPAAASGTAGDAVIRAAHFSPTTPGVDVYLGRFAGDRPPTKLWLSKVSYGAVSRYQALTPGVYTVAMRPAGAAADSPPVLSWTLDARPDAAYTVAGVGADASVRGVVLKDDLSSPPAGHGRVRVVQAASRAPSATVTASDGMVIAPDVRFATVSGYATLPSGRWSVRARATAGQQQESASGPVDVRAGQITSILLLDGKSTGIVVRTVLDSAAAGVTPRAAVDAGAGGTAPRAGGSSGTVALFVTAGLCAATGVALLRRRRVATRR